MQAVVDGARAHPDVVKAVFVGNEELLTGKWDQDFVIGHVRRMKQMLRDAGLGYIKVGAVQTDGSWFGGWDLAQECDIMGVNIHPYFGGSPDKPMDDLVARWDGVYSWYGDKLVLTEIGWPTEGTPLNGHVPSMETAKQLYADVAAWAAAGNGGEAPAYFMYNDNPTKEDFEKSFGLAWANGEWKWDFSSVDPPSPPNDEVANIVFVNTPNDYVLAAADDRSVEFHPRQGDDWRDDESSKWTIRGSLLVTRDGNTDLCLDAPEAKRGGYVHLWPCDENNNNQKWQYDGSVPTLRHAVHRGLCLDMDNPTGGAPVLYTCGDDFPLQKLEWWQA
ncbi:Aste57867_17485 [Aphanomyces stellatus]|uniref:glucan endo-1,3-beta-D-glucosidase n=1 Tax=Aphanomyces stellatus TaxID=120398 RepID=A0A485L9K0_9STRA|nr:hypothetical protein As57867_017425 [Aphanomyces stellatus]VFT94238.1 Aste57867_17485 [Aphanomyces stellatus]